MTEQEIENLQNWSGLYNKNNQFNAGEAMQGIFTNQTSLPKTPPPLFSAPVQAPQAPVLQPSPYAWNSPEIEGVPEYQGWFNDKNTAPLLLEQNAIVGRILQKQPSFFESETGLRLSDLGANQKPEDVLNRMTYFEPQVPNFDDKNVMQLTNWSDNSDKSELSSLEKSAASDYGDWLISGGAGYKRDDPNLQFRLQDGKMQDTLSTAANAILSPMFGLEYDKLKREGTPEIVAAFEAGPENPGYIKAATTLFPELLEMSDEERKKSLDLTTRVAAAIQPADIANYSPAEQAERALIGNNMANLNDKTNWEKITLSRKEKEQATWAEGKGIDLSTNTYTSGQQAGQSISGADLSIAKIYEGEIAIKKSDIAQSTKLQEYTAGLFEQKNYMASDKGRADAIGRMSLESPGIDWKSGGAADVSQKAMYAESFLQNQSEKWSKTAYKEGKANVLSSTSDELKNIQGQLQGASVGITPKLDDQALSAIESKVSESINRLKGAGFVVPDIVAPYRAARSAMQLEQEKLDKAGSFEQLNPTDQARWTEASAAWQVAQPAFTAGIGNLANAADTAVAGMDKLRSEEMLPFDSKVSIDLKQLDVANLRGDVAGAEKLREKTINDIETSQTQLSKQYDIALKDYNSSKSAETYQPLADIQSKWWDYEKVQQQLYSQDNQYLNSGDWNMPAGSDIGIPTQLAELGFEYNIPGAGSGGSQHPVENQIKDLPVPGGWTDVPKPVQEPSSIITPNQTLVGGVPYYQGTYNGEDISGPLALDTTKDYYQRIPYSSDMVWNPTSQWWQEPTVTPGTDTTPVMPPVGSKITRDTTNERGGLGPIYKGTDASGQPVSGLLRHTGESPTASIPWSEDLVWSPTNKWWQESDWTGNRWEQKTTPVGTIPSSKTGMLSDEARTSRLSPPALGTQTGLKPDSLLTGKNAVLVTVTMTNNINISGSAGVNSTSMNLGSALRSTLESVATQFAVAP